MTFYPVHPYCKFKTPLVEKRTQFLCPTIMTVMHFMADYCEGLNLPFVVTDAVSTPEEDKALSRVSDEHSTARAFDLSLHGWTEEQILTFIDKFERQYISVAAISKTTNHARLIFRHNNGNGDHIHVQVSRLFGITDPLKHLPAPTEA